ncbi:MAG: hypothetical protein KDN19_15900, partial [Verrucomicrobiae bacterium]|nr:hypothetical protein [Verrucomicrobiae bacterium]
MSRSRRFLPDRLLHPLDPGETVKGKLQTAFQYLVYLGYRATAGLATRLSLPACRRLGEFGGTLTWFFAGSYRRLARRNLRLAFGDEKNESEIRALLKRHFQCLGANSMVSFKLASMDVAEVEKYVRYDGAEHIEAAAAPGKGLIAAIAHLGPWELFAQLPSLGRGVAPATMYRALENPFINAHVVAQRSRIGVQLFDRSSGVYGPLKHLREGGGIGMLIDQHAGDLGIWSPFFRRLSSTTNLPALLSHRTGAAVISIAILPDGKDRWRVVYREPHFPDESKGKLSEKAAKLTAVLNEELEDAIRQAPEEWFWVHNRWKTPQPDFLLAETKRGLHLRPDQKLKPFRVLLRSPNPLGDACMAVPAIRAIRASGRPDLHLTVFCRENLRPVWENCPEVDEVLTMPRDATPKQAGALIRQLPAFEVAVLFPNSLRSALEAWFGKIPRRVGFRGHSRRWLMNQIVPPLPVGPPRHHAHSYLAIAERIGADISVEAAAIENSEEASNDTPKGFNGRKPRLGICPGAEYGAAKR